MASARLAFNGPSTAGTARAVFNQAWLPLLNATWHKEAGSGYGNTMVTLDQIKHHLSTQVYATRSWASSHPYPDNRIGFAWDPVNVNSLPTTEWDAQVRELASRLGSALKYAYAPDGGAANVACSPSGAYTWCACNVSGASFNASWPSFWASW
jgi:hypothetical protein